MSYGAVWADRQRPHQLYAGRLSVTADGIVLDGSAGPMPCARLIPREQIRAVHRGPAPGNLSGRGWLHLDLPRGGGLIVTTLIGAATLSELYDLVSGLL